MVTHGHHRLFGDVVDGEMVLNEAGEIVQRVWEELPRRFPKIEMDTFIVMPSHTNGIITNYPVGGPSWAPEGPWDEQ